MVEKNCAKKVVRLQRSRKVDFNLVFPYLALKCLRGDCIWLRLLVTNIRNYIVYIIVPAANTILVHSK